MATAGKRYLVDEWGRKRAVLLGIKEYCRLEELKDALDLDEAVRTAGEFRHGQEVRELPETTRQL